MKDVFFKQEEKALFSLRQLYRSYGYLPFKMNKFEEYDFYLQNKEFLISDRVITFNDTDGKLLALKPDVTLSIVKNCKDIPGFKQKLHYDENVYRVSENSHHFREILQTGVECIGDIDLYDQLEVVSLAAQSLATISDSFVLQISHLGILSSLLAQSGGNEIFRREATKCIADKNTHDLQKLCSAHGISSEKTQILTEFISIYGERNSVLSRLEPLCLGEESKYAFRTLRELSDLISETPYSASVFFDFSIVNDMSYYNGIVFKGFLSGICEGVLSGGQYDPLLRRMGKKSGAIGFALYLDLLETLKAATDNYDVDILLLYDDSVPKVTLFKEIRRLVEEGNTVSAQKTSCDKLRFREILDMRKESSDV